MSKGRRLAKNIGKSIRKKIDSFDADIFQFPFGFWPEDQKRDLPYDSAQYKSSPDSSPTSPKRKFLFLKMQSVQPPKKSCSLGTISTSDPPSPSIIDHDEILALTQEVKKFSDSLARLRLMFTEGIDPVEDTRVLIHEGLGEVLSVLNPVMQNYPALQSQDIFTAAKSLINMIKDYNYEEPMLQMSIQLFCEAIDELALAFSSSVSDYLMGDMGPQIVMNLKTRSMNNIAGDDLIHDHVTVKLSTEEQDRILTVLDKGVSLALQRAKVCSKYISDIIIYLEKKTQLEQDYAKNLSRLANTVQNSLKKEGFLPLQSVFCTALSQDAEFSSSLQATQAVVHSHKIVEPLAARKMDHDRTYKFIKEAWHREYRKMTESISNLRKAQNLYNTRQQDCDRAHELALKADGEKVEKRRKAEEESVHKAAEAETTYKACVVEANLRQQELFKVKRELLAKVRDQIQQCDQVIKEVTVSYFQLYHDIMSPLPVQYQTLCDSSKVYEPGSQYAEYLRRLPKSAQPCEPEVFTFEPYIQGQRGSEESRKESFHSNGSVSDHLHSPEGSPVASPKRDKYRLPVKAWGHQIPNVVTTSDTDSASCSSKSHESSPSGSPHRTTRRLVSSHSFDELTEEELIAAASASHHSQEKRSQQMKRTLTVAGEDGLEIPSLMMHRGRRNTTFGVDFQEQVDAFQSKVPPIVSKCLSEIEKRGVMIKGIYRVSGVKSKVENLCQKFDLDPEGVDLSEIHPNVISNVLKLYLRQLPEPLLTFRLYSDFIHTAKENMSGQLLNTNLIEHLKNLVCKLPSSNLRTCAVLMHHLHRVASQSEFNQMSASNLGIVFGPTLLRPLEGSASLASLVDTPHQTRAIELLIAHAHLIFGPSEDFQITPVHSPVEQLNQALSGIIIPGPGIGKTSPSASPRPKVQSSASEELPVFAPAVGAAVNQPWQCEPVLPGAVSQETSAVQTVAGSNESSSQPITSIKTPSSSWSYSKPPVTRSSSPPPSTRSSRSALPGSDMVAALTTSAAGMASMLIMSARTFPAEDSSLPPLAVKETDGLEKAGTLAAPVVDDVAQPPDLPVLGRDVPAGENVESKKSLEEVSKKKLHSLQLENIKYLTQAPASSDASESVVSSLTQGPRLTPSDSDIKPPATALCPQPSPSGPSPSQTIPCESLFISSKKSTRRSILEEMPIPTLSRPPNAIDAAADAVTIPASPTIKRKELPSKIPTSPGTQRSYDSRVGLEKVDRADKFRQEQRKLVKAIKSDAKIGTGYDGSRTSQDSPEKDRVSLSRSSGIFEDVWSGGCALSSRHSSQSDDNFVEVTSVDVQLVAEHVTQSTASLSKVSSKPLRSSTWTGKTEVTKATLISRQRPASSAVDSSPQTKLAASRVKALNMPSTSYVKKSSLITSTTKASVSSAVVTTTPSPVRLGSSRTVSTSKTTASVTSSDHSQHLCSRVAANISKSSEDASPVKTSSPVIRKSSGRGGELSASLKCGKTSSEKVGAAAKMDSEGTPEKSSPASSQSSSPRHRNPSGDSNHHARPGVRRQPSSSGTTGVGAQDKGLSEKSTGTTGGQQVIKSTLTKPSSSSTPVSSSTVTQSSSTAPSGKLSQDRTPRFV